METKGLVQCLIEIASEKRIGILAAIAEKPLKHAQIARRLDMTGSETTRHLNRLLSAGLVTRNSGGEYEATNLAHLINAGLPFFRFMTTNREFLVSHDLSVLPQEFI